MPKGTDWHCCTGIGMSTAPLTSLARVVHTPTHQLFFAFPSIGGAGAVGAVDTCAPRYGRWKGVDDHPATRRRWKRQRQNIRTWPPVALCSSPSPAGEERRGPQPTGHNADDLREDVDAFQRSDSVGTDDASRTGGGGRSGGRVAGAAPSTQNPRFDGDGMPKTSTKVGGGSGMSDGRLRLKWGIDLDIQVPTAVEALIKGPWDPDGAIWRKQLDMALEVIQRSGGVVFLDQLLPILNPREGPSEYYGADGRGGGSGSTSTSAVNEGIVRRLLYELKGIPEATSEGDILYVFEGLASTEKGGNGVLDSPEDDRLGANAEVLQFEEVSGFLEALPKILNDTGPKLAKEFFQRTTLSGLALFLATCLLLGQLIFGSWPIWLATGPGYLVWVGLDDTLKRSRKASAKQRDQLRRQWADACRGDSDAVWRQRAAARSRARRLSEENTR